MDRQFGTYHMHLIPWGQITLKQLSYPKLNAYNLSQGLDYVALDGISHFEY